MCGVFWRFDLSTRRNDTRGATLQVVVFIVDSFSSLKSPCIKLFIYMSSGFGGIHWSVQCSWAICSATCMGLHMYTPGVGGSWLVFRLAFWVIRRSHVVTAILYLHPKTRHVKLPFFLTVHEIKKNRNHTILVMKSIAPLFRINR